jgi:hypothetical protein
MSKPMGSGRMMVIRSTYGDVTGKDVDEVNDVLKPSYNGINAGVKIDKSRRKLDYGQEKPVNSPR